MLINIWSIIDKNLFKEIVCMKSNGFKFSKLLSGFAVATLLLPAMGVVNHSTSAMEASNYTSN